MPPRRTHNANPPLSTPPGNYYENIRVDGGQNHLGDAYYVPYGTETTRGGETNDQEDARYVLNKLEPYINKNASYNSYEREQQGTSICQPGTRGRILAKIEEWITGEGPPVLWLYGPAGAGKSTIAQTIAEQCDDRKNLAFSYFFSRKNANRNDLTKFMPTFAYELVRTLPSLGTSVREVIRRDPSIFGRRLELQANTLIVEPLKAVSEQMPRMVIVIDGLDEYSDDTGTLPLKNFIHVLVEAIKDMPFRIFFVSRPESYINAIFKHPQLRVKTMELPLHDWETTRDVFNYLRTELSRVRKDRQIQVFPWPSEDDLWTLAKKSEGIFIYASTLVKFVGARNCNSIKRLQEAMESHNGLDSLFTQVLDSAKEHPDFLFLLGIIMFLREPLKLWQLALFLKWSTHDIRAALEGSLSILYVPEGDDDVICPYHASLQDFLNDLGRSGSHFLDPATNHKTLFHTSVRLILEDTDFFTESGQGVYYAYRNWCYHLCSLINVNITSVDRTTIVALMEELNRNWCARLARLKSHEKVKSWLVDLEGVIACAKRGENDFEDLIKMGQELQENVHVRASIIMKVYLQSISSSLEICMSKHIMQKLVLIITFHVWKDGKHFT
ncbi:hypothetical protein M422DRAFT_248416 [Sphaerobolus stellatus SS14]|uniref:Nephrocystin 3-like N-terminal domain-containing protein n=1 Tax=Sphaerobolus stellatus (strain SS14) TaxID=990650 RepID=A0A0C9W4L9_SPHS4|nr:hypothetical protein M422DRAFT_248416 [Sphaerobolus stellatus SS14]